MRCIKYGIMRVKYGCLEQFFNVLYGGLMHGHCRKINRKDFIFKELLMKKYLNDYDYYINVNDSFRNV